MFCSIIPPYLLDEIARRGSGPRAERAAATLRIDRARRSERARGPRAALPPTGARTKDAPQRTIADDHHTEALPGTTVRREGDPATTDQAVNEAYDGLGDTWRLFFQAFRRSSLDDAGLPLLGTVHYGEAYDNAFWNGERMVFGDGDGTLFGRFTASVDVIGHELTHGVTEHTANLTYQGQSGALNESVSDVFGSMVRQFVKGQTADQADWLIGAELLLPGVTGVALRSMRSPGTAYDDPRLGKDPQPADMSGYVDTQDDNGGVHTNSGIPNRAFYLAATAVGGHAWEGAGLYWYDALTHPTIEPDCDFATFAGLTVEAARTRGGNDTATKVAAAWAEVGVTPGGVVPASSRRPDSPPRRVPGASSRVQVERSGGVAGTTRSATVDLAGLPGPEAAAWATLLDGRLTALADGDAAGHPDGFTYRVRCQGTDVTVPEHRLPGDVKELMRRHLG